MADRHQDVEPGVVPIFDPLPNYYPSPWNLLWLPNPNPSPTPNPKPTNTRGGNNLAWVRIGHNTDIGFTPPPPIFAYLHSNISAHKERNIRLFKWGLMRKTLFLIIKFLSQFLNKLMISLYTTMFYNNVTLYRKVLFWLKTCVNKKKYITKKHSRSSRANGKTKQTVPVTERRLHILESAYIYCVYIVSRINSERNNNIRLCLDFMWFLIVVQWWWHDKSILLINLIRSNYILSDHLVRSFW